MSMLVERPEKLIQVLEQSRDILREIRDGIGGAPQERPADNGPDLWLSIEQAAKHAALSPTTLRRAIKQGLLDAKNVSLGKKRPTYRVTMRQLNNFIENGGAPADERVLEYRSRHLPELAHENGDVLDADVDVETNSGDPS
ncbi:MAG: helix-turn-helix domain-containing protein [Alphaproteobacteria bacterium]|nr:MAG: helix-turn-helix domain-containing protein [Alphaproteobacteria bacterium]